MMMVVAAKRGCAIRCERCGRLRTCACELLRDQSGRGDGFSLVATGIVGVLALIAMVVVWRSLNFNSFNPGAIAFWVTVVVGCIAGSAFNWLTGQEDFKEIVSVGVTASVCCGLVYGIIAAIVDVVQGGFSIVTLLLAFVAAPFLVAAASIPLILLQGVVIWFLRKQGY